MVPEIEYSFHCEVATGRMTADVATYFTSMDQQSVAYWYDSIERDSFDEFSKKFVDEATGQYLKWFWSGKDAYRVYCVKEGIRQLPHLAREAVSGVIHTACKNVAQLDVKNHQDYLYDPDVIKILMK